MGRPRSLTEGNIFSSLIRFAVPVLFTLFLQALYGGVDLLVVGQFAQTADVSGVATGSMLLQTVTMVVTGLSMGITILVGSGSAGGSRRMRAAPSAAASACSPASPSCSLPSWWVEPRYWPGSCTRLSTRSIRRCCTSASAGPAPSLLWPTTSWAPFSGDRRLQDPSAHRCHRLRHQYLRGPAPGGRVPHGAAGAALATVAAQTVSVLVSLFLIRLRRRSLPFAFSPATPALPPGHYRR